MSNTKEKIILFIPGLGKKKPKPEYYLDSLNNGLKNYCEASGLSFSQLKNEEGSGVRNIKIKGKDNIKYSIHEVYWADLRNEIHSEKLIKKIYLNFNLMCFWLLSFKNFKLFKINKYLFISFIFTSFFLLMWYYGIFATLLTAIGAYPPEILGVSLPKNVIEILITFGKKMNTWEVWIVAAFFVSFLPVDRVIDVGHTIKNYIQNYQGFYFKINTRIGKVINNLNLKSVNEITIICHSFGVPIILNYLSDNIDNINNKSIRLITMGSPMQLLTLHSEKTKESFEKIRMHEKIISWKDFYSNQDWLCGPIIIDSIKDKLENIKITTTVSKPDQLIGESHEVYFDDHTVLKELI